jgi:hypothetical protein
MSTTEIDHTLPAEADICQDCGAAFTGGRFCSECGQPVAGTDRDRRDANGHIPHLDAAATRVTPPIVPAPTAVTPRRRRTLVIIGIAAATGLIVVGVVAAVLLTPHDGTSNQAAFQRQVGSVFAPVLAANDDLSQQLARIHGAKPTDPHVAVSRAQQASSEATGALGALKTPAGSEQLASNARQVLDRETAYLAAVSDVLSNQSSASRGQLETLSSNLTSAFSAAGPAVAGTKATVSGADVLTAWAQRTARVLNKRAQEKAARRVAQAGQTGQTTQTGTTAAATNPYSGGRDCGEGVFAGRNTSCDFAFNVRSAYLEAPGLVASVSAFSPATGQVYAMDCAPSGSGTTCSGANNASVTF